MLKFSKIQQYTSRMNPHSKKRKSEFNSRAADKTLEVKNTQKNNKHHSDTGNSIMNRINIVLAVEE